MGRRPARRSWRRGSWTAARACRAGPSARNREPYRQLPPPCLLLSLEQGSAHYHPVCHLIADGEPRSVRHIYKANGRSDAHLPPCLRRDQARARPVAGRAHARSLGQPGRRRGLADVARLDVTLPARLRREQPDVPPVGQRREGVDQRVDEVAVAVSPPEQDHVDHVVVVLVDQLYAVYLGDRAAQLLVAIIVVADLLHHLARLDTEPLGLAAFILGLARGRAHCVLLESLPASAHALRCLAQGQPPRRR